MTVPLTKPNAEMDAQRAVELFGYGADTATIAQSIYRHEAWVSRVLTENRDNRIGKTTVFEQKRARL
ncbi:hypothetical protein QFZ34_002084 [Phyllobacterium ifriqiyense]|uniref:Uncharacterized protein n=1 Tax=Phyllobacterium ifriqiyense TaxID=314238 RepID=A0ABU0S832_9HYPH|nr:hypothetical protein [Phyllobacterium ifriqiyense]MDQ0996902.1 hypothetical protein [Phyllobacterium ifriqiyense]